MKLLVDTNIIIDYINRREPYFEHARLLMLCGKIGEFELLISSSQVTDVIYIASNGEHQQELPSVMRQLRELRTFIKVCPVGSREIDGMLASDWSDPEDRLMYEVAASCNADAIITRDTNGFQSNAIRACTCKEFFEWVYEEYGLDYAEVALGGASDSTE